MITMLASAHPLGISPGEMMRNSPASEVNNDLTNIYCICLVNFPWPFLVFRVDGTTGIRGTDIVSAIVMVLSQQGRTAKDGDWGMVSRLDAEHGTALCSAPLCRTGAKNLRRSPREHNGEKASTSWLRWNCRFRGVGTVAGVAWRSAESSESI